MNSAGGTATATLTVTWSPVSIGAARNLPASTLAFIDDAVVTATTIGSAGVFVESSNRGSGITLVTSQALSVGQAVSFTGYTQRVGGEYQISNVTFLSIGPGRPLTPLGVTSKTLGNDLTESLSYYGINTTGLLVRMAGQVTGLISSQRIVYVNDGFNYEDGVWPLRGIRVHIPAGVKLPEEWDDTWPAESPESRK